MNRATDVGICALEIYFPSTYVDQGSLEEFDGVSKGKYTIGLGQLQMGFCSDNEDVNSLCLTVLANLMEKYDFSYNDIGRLEVGTETIVDKSKSVKSVLMHLFESAGNFDVEGIDTTNACYGGTSALFNAVAWMESSAWDGRYAVVICGDIAVYAEGNARCTGGAGAVAMLIGPNAPLVMESRLRGTYMKHAYDFYKPDLTSEYPIVDGKLSVQCYITALDNCYSTYCKKANSILDLDSPFSMKNFDYMIFHAPYCKLVKKSLARLTLNDYIRGNTKYYKEYDQSSTERLLEKHRNVKLAESIFDKEVEVSFMKFSQKLFEAKTEPSLLIASRVGNMYTPSLYSCLVSLLLNHSHKDLIGKRIGLFSYGSGLASTMFSLKIKEDKNITERYSLNKIVSGIENVKARLDMRQCVSPVQFAAALKLRAAAHLSCDYIPSAGPKGLFPGTYYLTGIDKMFRRNYRRMELIPLAADVLHQQDHLVNGY